MNLDGFYGRGEGYHFSLDVRGEYQHAPGRGAYPESVQEVIAAVDSTPLLPAEPVPQTNVFRLINANFATSLWPTTSSLWAKRRTGGARRKPGAWR